MDYAGLIYDDSRHYLDHLGPFCALLKWPLIICEPSIAETAREYYPDLDVREVPLWNLRLPTNTISCDTSPLLEAAFPCQKTNLLWLPHGNSDKGWNTPFFEALGSEAIAFVYGQKMIDFMRAKNVFPKTLRVGNFRWHYFLKHKIFYSKKIFFPKSKKTILYAPTWDDAENNCSFWKAFPQLATTLSDDCNLLVKLHPNTVRKYEIELEVLMGRYAKNNVVFLPEAPPIYPLLSFCDAYIGDMSSIGYDFLKFDRPMYFFNANQKLPLHQCGTAVTPDTFILSETDLFSQTRNALYNYTFDPVPNWDDFIHSMKEG